VVRRRRALVVALAVIVAACSPRLSPPGGLAGAPAPEAAVERFLQLAGTRDYSGMGWFFGTASGPVILRDPVGEVEERMFGLASLLTHDSFVVGNGSPVPGRGRVAMQFQVVLQSGGRTLRVPFVAVQGPRDRWFVEQVAVEAISGR